MQTRERTEKRIPTIEAERFSAMHDIRSWGESNFTRLIIKVVPIDKSLREFRNILKERCLKRSINPFAQLISVLFLPEYMGCCISIDSIKFSYHLIKIIVNMQVFRKKYLYNPEKPVFESNNVQTFNCMNTETKDNKLILIRHLKQPPYVDPQPGVLQPLQQPTTSEPMSVYPLVYCCSEIGKINQADAMYILKCLTEAKIKNPLYYVLSPQGVMASEVQGLLPSKSPSLFEIALDMLDVPASLAESNDSVISREGYEICKALRDGQSITNFLNNYGWTTPKKEKEKDIIRDDEFFIFKGKRKQQGPFNEEYSLSWNSKFGLCKFKYIDLSKDGYEEQFYQDYTKKMQFYQSNQDKDISTVQIHKYIKQSKGIKIFSEILNQGTLLQYITRRQQMGRPLNEKSALQLLNDMVRTMQGISQIQTVKSHGFLQIKNVYVHDHRIVIGQPFLVTDKIQKKLRELKTVFDYFSPQLKENIILPDNLFKLSAQKMDIWSFGFILHKTITRDLPNFDATRRASLNKNNFSPPVLDLIARCLSLTPANRPSWKDIDLTDLHSAVVVQEIQQHPQERQIVRLGTSKQMHSQKSSKKRSSQVYSEIREEQNHHMSEKQVKQTVSMISKQEEQVQASPIPVQLASKLKRVKLISKVIIIMILYVFVFFRSFLGNSIGIMLVRTYYGTVDIIMVDYSENKLATSTIITNQASFFVNNNVDFNDIHYSYNCINDQFDPIYNPSYSLLTYVQSPNFLAFMLLGWIACITLCVTKAVSIWKGGLSNRPSKNKGKYILIYSFHELSLASLLFSHFFIFDFFYFSTATPCLGITSFNGQDPFFDSSLYLFLENTNGYLNKIFSTLGVLAITLAISSCFYACGPKLDQKYFLSIPSILFRIIPYLLLILICRVGIFMVFSPSAINDPSQILSDIISNSADGFFGLVPEIFILICLVTQLLIELFFVWCEKKAAESDKLARLFNVRKKKISSIDESNIHINDMSLSKSKTDGQIFE